MTRPLLCGIDWVRRARRLDEQQVPFPRGRSAHRGCEQLAQRRYAQTGPDRESNFLILDTACACFKVSASAVFCIDILQLYSTGLFVSDTCVSHAAVNLLNK